MSIPADQRIMGLSRRARRVAFPFLAVAAVIVAVSYLSNRTAEEAIGVGPVVGGDLHAIGELNSRVFVGGHGGAGYRTASGTWTQIDSLDDKDVMGWAALDSRVLAGGHGGLYASTDNGSTFDQVDGLPVSDVHALGAAGELVYLASPEAGTLVSQDRGSTFKVVSSAGQDFMGTIWIDPANPRIAIAPSMQGGAVRTSDGGVTWTSLGSASGSMAVAVDKTGQRLLAIGMQSTQLSTDGGASWTPLDVPAGTSAAAYTSAGVLIVAVLADDRAKIYQQASGTWDPLP